MSRALIELRAHAENLGLRNIRVVYVGHNDIRDSFECRDLVPGFHWRPINPSTDNFTTKQVGWEQVTDAPYHYLASNLDGTKSTLTTNVESIKQRLTELGVTA